MNQHASDDRPKHYCGVFGIHNHERAAKVTLNALIALQHRGQESGGITVVNKSGFSSHRGMGLVMQVFPPERIAELHGTTAIGHTRYSTTGNSELENAQPLCADSRFGPLAIAHNGNLTNTAELREILAAGGAVFQTTTDSELILLLLAQANATTLEEALRETLPRLRGAYSLVLLNGNTLYGIRDPYGFRPLSLGKLDGAYCLASESCAFQIAGGSFIRDIEPGQVLAIRNGGLKSEQMFPKHGKSAFCIFEFVYFARPDSGFAGRSVYAVRKRLGAELAREYPIDADIVTAIPDSGNLAALGYAQVSGIPFEMVFIRNHYITRSFLAPTQIEREERARMKLNVVTHLVEGKRVIVIDDSLVRGTTCRAKVSELRKAGASAVHVLISCPPHRHSCHYGIDFPDAKHLMAATSANDRICTAIGADSLGYLSEEGLVRATELPKSGFCLACYNGSYPVPVG